MGLFKKSKKYGKVLDDYEQEYVSRILKREAFLKNDNVDGPNPKIETIQESKEGKYDTVGNKLELVKMEYQEVIEDLMDTKKELNEKKIQIGSIKSQAEEMRMVLNATRKEIDSIKTELEDKKSKLIELKEADSVLILVKNDVKKSREENESLQLQINESRTSIQQLKNQQIQMIKDIHSNNQKPQTNENIGLSQKEKQFIENELSPPAQVTDTDKIVKAASAVVAQANERLADSQKEIEILKKLLEEAEKSN